jgi:excinuclease ABC subunit A
LTYQKAFFWAKYLVSLPIILFLMNKKQNFIHIYGAREHNLQNLDLSIPTKKLVVITGLSGSGKSSLAFDTIYAEGQRRFIETFSAYARQFLGGLNRPDVDKIDGLSPVISIEQKTTNKNPRSTVGTITEIYDFLRLLYAKIGEAYSYNTGEKMISYSDREILEIIQKEYSDKKISILAPLIKSRKGHYKELFKKIAQQGYLKVRVDGEIMEIEKNMMLERYQTHDIDMVIDRLRVNKGTEKRLKKSIETAMYHGKNTLIILDEESGKIRYFSKNSMCPTTGIAYPEPEPNSFSFNSPKGACPHCKGLGTVVEVDLKKLIPNDSLSIKKGGIPAVDPNKKSWINQQLELIAKRYNFSLDTPIKKIPKKALDVILYGTDEHFEIFSKNLGVTQEFHLKFDGLVHFIHHQYHSPDSTSSIKRWAKNYMTENTCPVCEGTRLKKESRYYKINGKTIVDLALMDIEELQIWFNQVENHLSKKQLTIASELIKEIKNRIGFLTNVGLNYLNLFRSSRSLSGGESQRIRLASQIGAQLVNVLYILDEPSIGLHQRDNQRLIQSLIQLRDIGNSVIVVEHDKDIMEQADHIIDMGPKAGKHGGNIVAQGTYEEILKSDSLTSQYLSGKKKIDIPKERRKGNGKEIILTGASGNNLKNVTLKIPLGKLVVVTGVSGSGKSTLINETLYPILNKEIYKGVKEPKPYKKIKGLENIDKIIDIDQSPIGRSSRSNPATYTGVFQEIRNLFAKTPEAQIRGYKPGRFSFNVKDGRCPVCEGAGIKTIEMNLLPDVQVTCEACQGKRFNRETLEVRYKGKSISDVLDMTINEAVDFFQPIPKIYRKIKTLQDVGLGYLTLGQASPTLSGGEAQRVKLATELSKKDTGKTLYILDEPTTGLHFEDIKILMNVLQKLVDKGNSVVIIEHNMDVIKLADWIIDLGPEGGKKGGKIIAQGTPEQIITSKISLTGKFLKKELDK